MDRRIGTYTIDGQTIEYSITGNEGIPILVMHGGHSNCYETFGYHALIQSGFMIITPSRAGYGKTSREIGESLSKACHYYAELLNHLEIEKVHILSISAGGPSGLYFASQYPEKVTTLTLQSAVTKEWLTPKDKTYKTARVLFHPIMEKVIWKLTSNLSNCFPIFMFKQMASSFSNLPYKKIKEKMSDEDVDKIRLMNNRQRSGHGFLIDLSQTKKITSADLSAIDCPTLILHSKHDGAAPLEHAYNANRTISNSELYVLDTWGHLIWLGQGFESTSAELVAFLMRYSNKSKMGC